MRSTACARFRPARRAPTSSAAAARQQPLCQLAAGAGCEHRQTGLASATHPSRPVGFRSSRRSRCWSTSSCRASRCPAVIQATKTGMLYIFDRARASRSFRSRKGLCPPARSPGEQAADTTFFLPAVAGVATPLSPEDAWGITFWDRGKCHDLIAAHRNEGIFTPPDTARHHPLAELHRRCQLGRHRVRRSRQRVIATVNHLPMVVTLVPQANAGGNRRSPADYPHSEFARQTGTPYAMRREPLLSPWGLPCTAPPWARS